MKGEGEHSFDVLKGNKLFGVQLAKWCTYALVGFPIIDYALRMSVWHEIGSIWDKVVLFILALIALNRYIRGHRPAPFGWSKYAGWYILYCFALMLTGLGNPTVAFDGFKIDIYYILFGLLLPFIVEPEDVPYFIYGAVGVSILIGVDGVFQYVGKVPIPAGWVDVNEHVRTRVFSVLKSPAELGANMEMMIPIIFGLLLVDKHRIRKWVYGVGGLCCLGALLFTYDRGSWMGFGIAMLFIGVFYERRLLIVLILVMVFGFFFPPIHHRIMDLFNPVYMIKSSQGGRIIRWQTAFNNMAESPFFGVGMGKYGGAIASSKGYSIYSDNYYAKVLGESGIIGLVLFMTMHVAILREMLQTVVKRATGTNRYLALGGLAGTIAILVHSFVENLFEYSTTAMLYFLMVGFMLLWGRTLKDQDI